MMSDKKCKTCGDKAELELDGDCYCEICGKPGCLFVVFGEKANGLYKYGRVNEFYWICKRCEKVIRWTLARLDESKKEECENNPEEQK